jgi:hypothetical protein
MTACRIARTYRVAHTTIVRLSPALRSPEARPSVRRHSPPSADPGGRLPGWLAGAIGKTTAMAKNSKIVSLKGPPCPRCRTFPKDAGIDCSLGVLSSLDIAAFAKRALSAARA